MTGVDFEKEKHLGDRDTNRHGTHVTGIILGAKLGSNKPSGIAYEAKYYGAGVMPGYSKNFSIYDWFKEKQDLKIVNNSWSKNDEQGFKTMFALDQERTPEEFEKLIKTHDDSVMDLIRLSKDKDVLQVFSAGNDGADVPAASVSVPSLMKMLELG